MTGRNYFDGLLFVNARWYQLPYQVAVIALLWLTRKWRSGHWYFDAETFTKPKRTK